MKNRKKIMAGMLAVSLMFSGCSFAGLKGAEKNPPLEVGAGGPGISLAQEDAGEVHYYQLEEISLPNIKREMEFLLEEGQWYDVGWGESDVFQIVDGKLYRPIEIDRAMDEEERAQAGLGEGEYKSFVCARYVQYLEPPYSKCEHILLDENWAEDAVWEEQKFRVTKDGRMFVLLKKAGSEEEFAVGEIHRDGSCELLLEPEAEEAIYKSERELKEDSELMENIVSVGVSSIPVVCADAESGTVYFSDQFRLWKYGEFDSVKLLNYADIDVVMDKVCGMSVTEEGFIVMGDYKSNMFLLKLTETPEPVQSEKQEVVLAITTPYPAIQEVIANFNRKSQEYKVVIMKAPRQSAEGYADFRLDIQMQISSGKGPDILDKTIIWDGGEYKYEQLAAKGYLAELDSVIENRQDFLPAALEYGMMDGVRYGLPVIGRLGFLACRRTLAGDRDTWTAEEMMAAVEKSGAEWACFYMDGMGIVEKLALCDNKNTAYIDWKAGESHLTEEPFLRVLEFARKYAAEQYTEQYVAPLREGRIALLETGMSDPFDLQWLDECFEGQAAIIGYPCSEGSGMRMSMDGYFLNASAQCPEGAKEFLRYLLTDEAQTILTFGEWGRNVPVRRSTLEGNLREFQKHLRRTGSGGYIAGSGNRGGISGIFYETLSDEEVSRILDMCDKAELDAFYVTDIMDIFEEELAPYFSGDRSAEDVVKILDNRVQLYLDERK